LDTTSVSFKGIKPVESALFFYVPCLLATKPHIVGSDTKVWLTTEADRQLSLRSFATLMVSW